MPLVAQHFLEDQEIAALTWRDRDGLLWTTPLTGERGFLSARDDETVECNLSESSAPFVCEQSFQDVPMALVVMDFNARRRMRINGTGCSVTLDGRDLLLIKTAEVYANCPKYIQRREVVHEVVREVEMRPVPLDSTGLSDSHEEPAQSDVLVTNALPTSRQSCGTFSDLLSDEQQRFISGVDTFFIGTFADGNADASHRGGNPGFVQANEREICWFDYPGNNMFNTLGNVQSNREGALLFPNFVTRDCLAVTGEISAFAPSVKGDIASSATVFRVKAVRLLTAALHREWRFIESSPFNP